MSTDERNKISASRRTPHAHVSSHKSHRESTEVKDGGMPSNRPKRRKRKGKKSDDL